MHIATQSENTPVARHWAQNLYLALASLVLFSILLQGILIGAFFFGGATWGQAAHGFLGMILPPLTLLLALVGVIAQVPGRMRLWGFLLFALMIVQVVLASLSDNVPLVAALHPANAMILFGLTLFLIFRIRQIMRERN